MSLKQVAVRAGVACALLLVLVLLLRSSGVTKSQVLDSLHWQEVPDDSERRIEGVIDVAGAREDAVENTSEGGTKNIIRTFMKA